MNALKSQIYASSVIKKFSALFEQESAVHLTRLAGSLRAFVISYLVEQMKTPVLYVAADSESAEKLRDDLELLLGRERVAFLPALEFEPFDEQEPSPSLLSLRIDALDKCLSGKTWAAVAVPQGIAEPFPQPEQFKQHQLHFEPGQDYSFDRILQVFGKIGLRREELVQNVGDFAVRGGIIDFFVWNYEDPIRLEFFGNTLESIRRFDVFSQRSVEKMDYARVLPNLFFDWQQPAFISQIIPRETVLFYEDQQIVREKIGRWFEQAEQKAVAKARQNEPVQHPRKVYLSPEALEEMDREHRLLETNLVQPEERAALSFDSRPHPDFNGSIKLFIDYLKKKEHAPVKPQIVIQTGSPEQMNRLQDILDEEEINLPGRLMPQALHQGFILNGAGVEVLTDHEIFNRFKRIRTYRRFKSGEYLRQLSSLNLYDYVVHVDYGIGQYLGMEKLDYGGVTKECIKIGYRDGDYLYVTVDRLNRVQKYSSEEGQKPRLTKLGTPEWERAKKKTKESLKKMAGELIRIYAARKAQGGHRFLPDSHWQKELEATFAFEETPDQLKSISEVKRDMESDQPMDRLLCGDVGFGKTEVALRAAFKAVMDGKQVAILVPTTILAFQHYETFRQRLEPFPVQVELLNRFRSVKEQKRILKELAEGRVDIVIGTHRLLSDDVRFKDLGLLVIDEEQRFGVRQKEKLKKYRLSVDVLSMTATPIPRTMHMALLGARDLSNIDTAPRNRLPVHTEIIHWNDTYLRNIILRELKREGQVFFVHNRVETIQAVKETLSQIVPEAKIAVGHGQLPERQLERVMLDFMHRKYDILLATMIIENGLDIPNVNTIIINRADKFGLSQLYQLRGRVGRSDEQAYAYLVVPPIEKLSETARKRLRAIQDFTELGSGYKVALRDLEIRGAGNLLGKEQSGFVQSVGFDMYCKLLEESVKELQSGGEAAPLPQENKSYVDPKIDVDFDLLIPEEYIPTELERITIYHRLVNFSDLEQVNRLREELKDRFGTFPEEVERFLQTIELKILSSRMYAARLIVKGDRLKMIFSEQAQSDDHFFQRIIPGLMNQSMTRVRFSEQKDLAVEAELKGGTTLKRLTFAKKLLQSILEND